MARIEIELARVVDGDVRLDRLALDVGSTVGDALAAAVRIGILREDELDGLAVGVFGRARPSGHRLQDGDRVELTAALRVDPKVARQRRVAKRRAAQPRDMWNPTR